MHGFESAMCKKFLSFRRCKFLRNYVEFHIPQSFALKTLQKSASKSARLFRNPHPNPQNYAEICMKIYTILRINAKRCKILHTNTEYASKSAKLCRNPHQTLQNFAKIRIRFGMPSASASFRIIFLRAF